MSDARVDRPREPQVSEAEAEERFEIMRREWEAFGEQSRRFSELWHKYYDESRPWWLPKFLDDMNKASRRFSPRCERARARAFMETHTYDEYAKAVKGLGGEVPMSRYVPFDWGLSR